jgi:alpha-tubulin suppressor-like RCC1 family protein
MRKLIVISMLSLLSLFIVNISRGEVFAEMVATQDEPYTYYEDLYFFDQVEIGSNHSAAIDSEGNIFTWGYNYYGQLGDGTSTNRTTPTEITNQFGLVAGETITSVSLGGSHSAAITSKGRIFTWGNNEFGQLGDGTSTSKNIPTEITSFFNLNITEKISSISIGYSYSSAITSEGRIFTWGVNYSSVLGDGTTTHRYVPTDITNQFSLNTEEVIINVFFGSSHSGAITSQGRVFTWGLNNLGQLGVGESDYDSHPNPIEITNQFPLSEGELITEISLGVDHSSAITSEGRVFTWGYNSYGQLGDGTTTQRNIPTEITNQFVLLTGETVRSIFLGSEHSLAMSSYGRIYVWGRNSSGQLGDGTTTDRNIPKEITSHFYLDAEEVIKSISMGFSYSSGITSDGKIFTWGSNRQGQLGDGTTTERNTPTEITNNFNAVTIIQNFFPISETISDLSLGGNHSSAITSEGRLFTWGDNNNGQLGDGTTEQTSIPKEITHQFSLNFGEKIISVSLGYNYSSAITSEGRIFTWGYNAYGQLGNSTTVSSKKPIEISSQFDMNEGEIIKELSLGRYHSSAITSNGRVFVWGLNSSGQLGNNLISYDSANSDPIEITNYFGLNDGELVISISMGSEHSIAYTSEGRIFTWGNNTYGQLGDGTTINKNIPTEITSQFGLLPSENPIRISAGSNHNLLVTNLGRIFSWGKNNYGQLGDGTTDNRLFPREITNEFALNLDEIITEIYTGEDYSFVQTSQNRIYSWGFNETHVLTNNNYGQFTPIEVTNSFSLIMNEKIDLFSLGSTHASMITDNGRLFIWGMTQYDNLNTVSYPTEINKIYTLYNTIQLVYSETERNYLYPNIKLSIFTEYEISDDIASINVNGNDFTNIENKYGRIDVYVPNEGSLGDTLDFTVNSITFANGNVMTPTGDLTTSTTLVEDTFAPTITFDYEEELYFEVNVSGDNYLQAIAIDDTGDAVAVSMTGSVDWMTPGTYDLTYTATDISGNTATRTRTVYVMPNVSISGTVYENMTFYYFDDEEYSENTNLTDQIIRYNSENFNSQNDNSSYVFDVGDNDVLYEFIIDNRLVLATKKVYYPDTEAPTFDIIEDQTIEVGLEDIDWTNYINNVNDNYSSDLILSEEDNVNYNTLGIYTVTVNVEDESGNKASQTFNVTVEDTIAPTFDFIEDKIIEVGNEDIDWTNYINNANDNYSSDLFLSEEDSVNYNTLGTYTVTINVEDESGNKASQTFNVTVEDTIAPTFDFIEDKIIEVGNEDIDWTLFISNEYDNYSDKLLKEEVEDTIDYNNPGDYSVTVSLTDESGNHTTATISVSVYSSQKPKIIVDDNINSSISLQRTLSSNIIQENNLFGFSVDSDDDYVIVGSRSGYAILYKLSDSDYYREITPSDGGASFYGTSVAIDGDIIVVGSLGGKIYVYKISDPSYERVIENTGYQSYYFGSSVGVSGNNILVGAPGPTDGSRPGKAFLYQVDDLSYMVMLSASDEENHNYFGDQVAIDGNNIVISAPFEDKVYIYQVNNLSNERIIEKIDSNHYFGLSIAISGNYLVVGSPKYEDNLNQYIMIYKIDDLSYSKKIEPSIDDFTLFGASVDIDNGMIVVGTEKFVPQDEEAAIFIYDIDDDTYELIQYTTFYESNINYRNIIPQEVVINGDYIIYGQQGDDTYATNGGSVNIYQMQSVSNTYEYYVENDLDWELPSVYVKDNVDSNLELVVSGDVLDLTTSGTYTIIFNATDSVGNIADEVRIIVTVRTSKPFFDFIDDQVIEVSEYMDIDWTSYIKNPIDYDSDTFTLIEVEDNVDYNSVGVYTVTVKIMDPDSNESSQTFEVTVTDTKAPIFTPIEDQFLDYGNDTNIDWLDYYTDLADNSGKDIEVIIDTDIDYDNLGDYTVTMTFIDESGNESKDQFNVQILDMSAPSFDIIQSQEFEENEVDSFDWLTLVNNLYDNYTTEIHLEVVTNTVDFTAVGDYVVTITAVDEFFNFYSQTFEVSVLDTEPPIFDVYNQEIESGQFDDINWIYYIENAKDDSNGLLSFSEVADNVDYDTPGTYEVTVKVSDQSGNETSKTFEVAVIDTTPPEFDITIEAREGDINWTEYVSNITDNSKGDFVVEEVEDNVIYNQPGLYTVIVSVSDESNNTAYRTLNITVVDTIKPQVSLNPSLDSIEKDSTYTEYGITAIDVTDTTYTIEGEVDITSPGVYELRYIVTDTSGNETIIKRYITVYDKQVKVEFKLGNAQTTLLTGEEYIDGTCQIIINDDTYNCEVKENTIDTSVAGIYYITYTYSHEGKEHTYRRYIFVLDSYDDIEAYLPIWKEDDEQ